MVLSDAAIDSIGGAVGASISLAATYPLLIVSTWQALEHPSESNQDDELARRYKFLPSPFKELCMQIEERGIKSLFIGLKPSIIGTAVSQAVYFYIYSSLRDVVVSRKRAALGSHAVPSGDRRSESIGVFSSMAVALLAGCGNVLATTPMWVIVTQMQAEQRVTGMASRSQSSNALYARGNSTGSLPSLRCRSALEVISDVYSECGFRGFWKGVSPSLVMVSNPTLQYIMYEWLIGRLRKSRAAASGGAPGNIRLTPRDAFLMTAAAKLGATLVTYPMLLIKSRMQAENSATHHDQRYNGVLDAVIRIIRQEGLSGLYKGIRLKLLQTVLAAALLMAIKEEVYTLVKTTAAIVHGTPAQTPPGFKTNITRALDKIRGLSGVLGRLTGAHKAKDTKEKSINIRNLGRAVALIAAINAIRK
uniref:Uncharacterized protein n=1 Tax=Polytomella parva TaxID=51329 RepID=A0A7S0UVS8_9CHLO|mmetsp:Transcript_19876/g.35797  ORF Transcript_19876/g.35797 Transcript_19876/m.35797 type:complete len:419 (+) Transcript_19876:82-1338(+)|eukprot:CAMPEP_0175055704 /NCGR_PEP_ID=MMETSP0052_2-20121109/10236_1 /TAXON_ID=51329 ORGANISM="Polytomella parva, Strain SAG 63-3" /NCGR_SAMPLE_ID=MMETSP0052_2 /ASSEMBLY_ACC=CAM_ASM_000194 /LENGTH=418 /DNA_ID=CAMNT_0016320595 /DNA_START=36 /DNA_END=1292 /DNA_ORIENTATION=+